MEFLHSIGLEISLEFWIVLAIVGTLLLVQALYYFLVYLKPYSYEKKRDKTIGLNEELPAVSVIIASKNESEGLIKNLPLILEQDYPNFEVIVVNMGSTDETYATLKELSLKYPNLYHTFVPADAEDINSKKLALTLGVKAAKNEILLFTEAYCSPDSDKWIEEIALEFLNDKDIVLGYNRVEIDVSFPMRGFVKYDNMMHHTKFLSLAIMNKAFMGIGRNLSYKRSVFFEENGFSSVLKYYEGEDDLFINSVAKGRKVGVVVSSDSFTNTDIVNNFKTWGSLKSKYINGSKYYKGASSIVFGFETFTKYLFYISIILSIVYGVLTKNYSVVALASVLFLVRFIITLNVINKLNRLFKLRKIHVNLLSYELFQPMYNYKFKKKARHRRS